MSESDERGAGPVLLEHLAPGPYYGRITSHTVVRNHPSPLPRSPADKGACRIAAQPETSHSTRPRSHRSTQGEHWSARAPDGVHDDLAWSYLPAPLPKHQKIAGLIPPSTNEKVDIYVERVLGKRPTTKFS